MEKAPGKSPDIIGGDRPLPGFLKVRKRKIDNFSLPHLQKPWQGAIIYVVILEYSTHARGAFIGTRAIGTRQAGQR
jgi:hypothetical protein